MNIGIYDIVNDPLPQLNKIKDINVNLNDFKSDKDIVKLFNKHLKMDKLISEHIYGLSLTYALIPKGIIQVAVGKSDKCMMDSRTLAAGLLLTGAEQFMMFHNHPGGSKIISQADIRMSNEYERIGNLLSIDFIRHIMITKDYWAYCHDENTDIDVSKLFT